MTDPDSTRHSISLPVMTLETRMRLQTRIVVIYLLIPLLLKLNKFLCKFLSPTTRFFDETIKYSDRDHFFFIFSFLILAFYNMPFTWRKLRDLCTATFKKKTIICAYSSLFKNRVYRKKAREWRICRLQFFIIQPQEIIDFDPLVKPAFVWIIYIFQEWFHIKVYANRSYLEKVAY